MADRKFDDAMSEAQSEKDSTASKTDQSTRNQSNPAQSNQGQPRNDQAINASVTSGPDSREETGAQDPGVETSSDELFTSLFVANGNAAQAPADSPDDTNGSANSTPRAAQTPSELNPQHTPPLDKTFAIDAPLPEEGVRLERIQTPTSQTIDPEAVEVQTTELQAETQNKPELSLDADIASDADNGKITLSAHVDTNDGLLNPEIKAQPETSLPGDPVITQSEGPETQPITPETARVETQSALASREESPRNATGQTADDSGVTPQKAATTTDMAEGDIAKLTAQADKSGASAASEITPPRTDANERAPRASRVEAEFVRPDSVRQDSVPSDRAYAATSTSDLIPEADRLMPQSSKPLSLTALADTVSLPGLSNALPASSPLTSPLGSISGLSERLAASLLQTANANPTVTLDKLPQTVVTVALSSRSATIQIDPPELGRIQLDYQFDSQGRTVVILTPESEAARAALVDRMATITAALEQGSSSSVDVKLGDSQDFGNAFSEASGDGSDDGQPSSSSQGDGELNPETPSIESQSGHHIAEDGTSRLHMRV